MPGSGLASGNADRLDLLARMLDLRGDVVTLALSHPLDAARNDLRWNELHGQADALGRQWAASDPQDAHRLLPSLLSGMSGIGQRLMDAYADAVDEDMRKR